MSFHVFSPFCAIFLSTSMLFGNEYYVATNGNDNNRGSLDQPFATIQHAVSVLKAGDICHLRGGRYHEAAQITGLKGREGLPITIQPYKDERVILDGSVPITTEWTRHKGQIFKTRLKQEIWQLFINGESMISARWPNASWKDGSIWNQEKTWGHQADESTYGRVVNDPTFQNLAGTGVDFTNAVVMLNIGAWITYVTKVTSHKKGSESFTYARDLWERLENEVYWKHRALETGWYFFEGSLAMLDTVGEWVYQPDTKLLYFWPRENNFPENLEIRGKSLSYGLQFYNCEYVNVKGLDFFASTFRIEDSKHVTVEDGDFMYPSYSKRMLGITAEPEVTTINGSENTLLNCTFAYTDGAGIVIKGEKNLIENCYFHNINYSSPGDTKTIDGGEGIETVIRHNTLHTGGSSVGLRGGPGNIIEYNNIYNIGYLQTDGALVQLSGPAQEGTVIRYNWLHESAKASRYDDDPKFGIRFDGSYMGYLAGERDLPHSGTVHHNVIWETRGMYIKGDSHLVYNNLSFDNLRNDIAIRSAAGKGVPKDPMKGFSYEGWGPGPDHPGENHNSIIRNNLSGRISSNLRTQSIGLPGQNSNNWAGDVRTQLRDPEHLDFRLAPGSPLINSGYYIDGITDEMIGDIPDIGPYEAGTEHYWIPGSKSRNASNPVPPDNATDVLDDCDLMWLEGYQAHGHEVYFGINRNAVAEANRDSPEYKGKVKSNILNLDKLENGVTYYWRVDVILGSETIKGDVWSFIVSRFTLPERFN